MQWFLDNQELVLRLSLQHLSLSIVPIVLGAALSIPVGWCANRFRRAGSVVLAGIGLIYTIPSLALFVLLPPLLNLPFLSPASVTIALTLYAVAIMSRSVADGLASTDPTVLRAATALGFGGFQRFFQVELPLAGPVILASLRVVAVSTVSLATVGVLVGVPSLGYLFTDGFQRKIVDEILTGLIATVVIAVVIDALLVVMGKLTMPWANQLFTVASDRGTV